jgi:hypothetical protein
VTLEELLEVEVGYFSTVVLEESAESSIGDNDLLVFGVLEVVGLNVFSNLLGYFSAGELGTSGNTNEGAEFA